jgi:hypothetical protein
MSSRAGRRLTAGLIALSAMATCPAIADDETLQPFVATYSVEWRGMSAGTSTFELARSGADEYVYSSRNVARGFFRLAVPGTVTQTSHFTIADGFVRPASYRADDGSSGTARDVTLNFDWQTGRANGTAEDRPVNLPLKPGTQDSISVQIALMLELLAGRAPEGFWLLDKDEIKEYRYTREEAATVETPAGKFETVIYRSERSGSSRVTRLWLAPSLQHLPVRAEQLRNGKRELTLTLRESKRG